MKATLSYKYVGERFDELSGQQVVVKEIAELADIPYKTLQNRMGMKKRRASYFEEVCITDKDLLPRTRERRAKSRSNIADGKNKLSTDWLKRSLV